jgi:polyketide biosynthesis enoyl-CoA hydratase PksH
MGVLMHNGHDHNAGKISVDHDRYETLRVAFDTDICSIQINRPQANNTINNRLIQELRGVLDQCERAATVVVLEGLPEVFCFGADFKEIDQPQDTEGLYDVWLKLAEGSFVSVAHVRGKVNAGGVGFVAACDVVISEQRAVYSLSELLFGLMPACVLPFLMRRIGFARANHMTVMTQPVSAQQAHDWGLVDICAEDSVQMLRRQLLRLRRLSKTGLSRYKRYRNSLDATLTMARDRAIASNREVFSDPGNLAGISRYVTTGKFPWEP